MTTIHNHKSLLALKWIAKILNDNNVPYRLGGGAAVAIYGSSRPINDIDISVSGKYFPNLLPIVSNYIVTGPKHYKNAKWDCHTLSLNYEGQDIDLTDADTLLMSKKDGTGWIKNKEIYDKHTDININLDGVNITIMNPKTLIEYKRELSGEHQEFDIKFLEKYINDNYEQK